MDCVKMRGMALFIVCCTIVISTCAAATPDQIVVTSDQEQIPAGGTGALILVEPDLTLPEVASVSFSYLNSTADPSGTLSVPTDTAAPFETLFTSEHAGTAYIQADVTFADGSEPVTAIFTQHVIPADPYAYETIAYSPVYAGSADNITVRMLDQYGNTITADTGATVTFSVSKDGVGFAEGEESVQTITIPFDADGNCIARFLAPEKAGPAIVSISPSAGSSLQRLITMDVVALRSPAQITPHIVTIPNYPVANTCPADGASYFRISYVVTDQFGNLIDNYPVNISTSLGQSATIITSEYGVARFTYGPSTGMGDFTVTGMAGTASVSSILSFTGGLASRFSVAINPNNIPSNDVSPDARIEVKVQVYNDLGTGVEGETVKAWMKNGSVSASNTLTSPPGLSTDKESGFGDGMFEAVTGEDGIATFYFRAGAFPLRGEEGFDPFSWGGATVTAMWNGQTADSPQLTWRNYPYVRVETEVSDTAIAPGDPLDVTIRLIGDGNELFHDPIDVALCLDRGEDMLLDEGSEDRMECARRAAMNLVRENSTSNKNILNPGSDRVALVTYSDKSTNSTLFPVDAVDLHHINDNFNTYNWIKYPGDDSHSIDNLEKNSGYVLTEHYPGNNITGYEYYATIDEPFYSNISTWGGLRYALDATMPFKADDTGQASAPLREGLRKSIEYLADNPNEEPCAIRAVVLLMQNNYRYFGDPFAEGSVMDVLPDANTLPKGGSAYYWYDEDVLPADQQNMVDYARANGVKIYAIYYPSGNSQADEKVPKRLAEDTGGEYYFASNEEDLAQAFIDIRDKLLRDAAAKTKVNLNFAGMPEEVTYAPEELLEYKPNTTVSFYNWSANPYTATDNVTGHPYEIDQSAMWRGEDGSQPASLSFEVGNITIKQTWAVHFRLQVNESVDSAMNFSLFAPGSDIQFENKDGTTISESLPETVITIIPGLTPEALLNASVQITAFDIMAQDKYTARFNWTITYDGAFPLTEKLELKRSTTGEDEESIWQTICANTLSPETETISSSGTAFISDLVPGTYTARIKVTTQDAGHDNRTLPLLISDGEEFFIRLE